VFSSTVPVSGNGDYVSASFVPTAPGAYQWVASYSGDAIHPPVQLSCDVPAQAVFVLPVVFEFSSQASGSVPVGGTLTDTAFLVGGNDPTGTVTFDLFGPDDATCAGPPIFSSTVAVSGNGAYISSAFIPSAAGTYRWVASYSGDANNGAARRACDEPAETVTVFPTPPPAVLTTRALRPPPGNPIFDLAELSGGTNPTGTITFDLFGPNDATCAGPPTFTSTKVVSGAGSYLSDSVFGALPGTYQWVASYSGDADNAPVRTACDDPDESVTVLPIGPVVLTTAATGPGPGGAMFDTATVSGGALPSGTVTFHLFGPDDPTCAGPPAFSSTTPILGAGSYPSAPFVPPRAGVYRWVASYSGDVNNLPVGPTACDDPSETVVIENPQGFLTICMSDTNGVRGDRTFTVETRTITVAAGACSSPILVAAGEVTVAEAPPVGFKVARCTTVPTDRLVECRRHAGSSVVRVIGGGTDQQTIVTFTDRRASGRLKICKVAGNGVADGSRHIFRVNGRRVVVNAGAGPGGRCALAGPFPVGTQVQVVEKIKGAERVSAIVVRPVRRLVGTPDLGAATVTVAIDTGVTEVRFTDDMG